MSGSLNLHKYWRKYVRVSELTQRLVKKLEEIYSIVWNLEREMEEQQQKNEGENQIHSLGTWTNEIKATNYNDKKTYQQKI